jgi:hypothetical protein
MRYTNIKKVPQSPSKKSVFRPTAMSVALARAGFIPDVHLTDEHQTTLVVRNRNDNFNQRRSVTVAL